MMWTSGQSLPRVFRLSLSVHTLKLGTLLDPDGFINMDLAWFDDPGTGVTEQERDSYAYYLDGSYQLNEKWRLTAGVRYTKDEKDFFKLMGGGGVCNEFTVPTDAVLVDPTQPFSLDNCAADIRSGNVSRAGITGRQYDLVGTAPPKNYGVNLSPSSDWDETTWRMVVDYQVSDDQLMYGSVSTGFIAGGFTETCSTVVTCEPYEQETNINYEFGYKADFLDGTLRINTAVFFTEFEDIQRNQVVPFIIAAGTPAQETITVNAGESEAYGLEVEATWLASDQLTIKAGRILEAEYTDFEFDPQPNNPATGIVDFSGLDVPFASPLQWSLDATYDIPLDDGASIQLNLNANYQDEAETSPFDSLASGGSFLAPRTEVVVRHPTNTHRSKIVR